MNKYGFTFHHFGLAVTKPQKSFKLLSSLGYEIGAAVEDVLQNVNLCLCQHSQMPSIELIWKAGENGPLTKMLEQTSDLIYHICYETKDLEASLDMFKSEKIRVFTISPPKPAILFDNRKVSFYRIDGFGIIELLEL